jgi:hypothetical protein
MIPTHYLSPEGRAIIQAERNRVLAMNKARRQKRERDARYAEGLALARKMRFSEDAAHELAAIYSGEQQ